MTTTAATAVAATEVALALPMVMPAAKAVATAEVELALPMVATATTMETAVACRWARAAALRR